MHLLATQAGAVDTGEEAVDLDQSPGEIVVLTAAASEIALVAEAKRRLGRAVPSVRLANVMQLAHNLSVDYYVDKTLTGAKLIIVRLLGGVGYWRYGVERIAALADQHAITFVALPGDDRPDPELESYSTVEPEAHRRLWTYLQHGGPTNAENFLLYGAALFGQATTWREPKPLARAGLYRPGEGETSLEVLRRHWTEGAPVAPILFYRALFQASDTEPVDALAQALAAEGLNPLPAFVSSLRDEDSVRLLHETFLHAPPAVIVNATGFAVSRPGVPADRHPLDRWDCPVIQAVLAGGDAEAWRAGKAGLGPRDIAMHVALPEVDGRIIGRAVSFKSARRYDPDTEVALVHNRAEPSRVAFVAELTRAWSDLRATPCARRRVAIVLANYPNRDGRLANGVGLDTPASVALALRHLKTVGYAIPDDMPCDGRGLMDLLREGSTNRPDLRPKGERLTVEEYRRTFDTLPEDVRLAVEERWGTPETDPFVIDGAFVLSVHRFGGFAVGIQPARGYNLDPLQTYHDPALVPPHRYLAFYVWLRRTFRAHVVVQFGKHGNLEWLPGKSLALSDSCFPEVAFGPTPHLYPFIVNDPGEGTQAKRRAQAVILDHLTPPLTRAESYGDLAELERLIDEYYLASGLDGRRLEPLREEILSLSATLGLDRDLGFDDSGDALEKLDNYLCELKEMQIRGGLHVYGAAPTDEAETDLLAALARVPRGDGAGENGSLQRAIASDLGLDGFDPLDCEMGGVWTGPRPVVLEEIHDTPWRTNGDTVERIELLAGALIGEEWEMPSAWRATASVLCGLRARLRPALRACAGAELDALVRGLEGRFVAPGPSGAPTRGRPDVLPTGRNFYSVDNRAVPTQTAWTLGWKSANRLVAFHFQEHGEYPRQLAMSAWGTANMRTGGDDIAQALALMGVRPQWETASGRLTGFEILPLSVLDRPRVDVVFRVSGFFRDAFPHQLDLLDSVVRAVAALNEPTAENPLADNVRRDAEALQREGVGAEQADRLAGHRVFGSQPGAYGAGLQALIDESAWTDEGDLADAYLRWGGFAYGGGREGQSAHDQLRRRLAAVDTVVHNQDNREHDLLDSDDYYQFEGGLAATVRTLSGRQPSIYHNDHSRPESPRIRTLADEIGRVVRARAVNPKWLRGVMRHGYKGAFEIAATVDYLFAFAATSGVVGDHHFQLLYDAYVADEAVADFMREANPDALREMAARFAEAIDRGLWRPKSNAAAAHLEQLKG